ncbi:hypothetical protein BV22DRAFT_849551 [Leucogyrophana mollusca]|uniref:Uncharacterized protein n=1 Tax=Leucogyrophana mollusca TaxID=85980 RepID=A0ACB8B365_9AGAM|nr:hypothetical protein BV22DRAFT_849551 [Leucogyrophana mollusca]
MLTHILEGEIQPDFGACESKLCSCAAEKRGLQVCILWVAEMRRNTELNQAAQDLPRVVIWRYARAALHVSAVASCIAHRRVYLDMWHPSCGGHLGRQTAGDFQWAADFLDHHCGPQDETAVGDMFVMLYQTCDISLWANEPAFVKAIIVAMEPDKPTRVRHAALRTAWEIREALRSPGNAILPLLPAFSSALRSAVLTNIHSEEDTTTWDSPDGFFDWQRDLCYLQIIYALVRSSGGIWDRHLHDNGHFD